jgi:hypothetical protein
LQLDPPRTADLVSGAARIANAAADALGVDEIALPLTPERVLALLRRRQSPAIG